ncbi:MAG: FecR family protein [Mangrovibacterium sp.]
MKKTEKAGMEASSQDGNSLHNWIEKQFEDEKNEPGLKENLKSKWIEFLDASTPAVDLKHILYKIHFNMNLKEKGRPVSKTEQLYHWFSKVAAVIVFPLLILSIYLVFDKFYEPLQFSEIVAPKGEKVQFVLPDGSSGYLNSGSTLKYAYPFHKRLVELDGEGFFDVVHAKETFTVQTSAVKVEVHGTRFNVCAYRDDPDVVTTLEEGSVTVIRDKDGAGLTIKPGQQAIFNKANSQVTSNGVNVDLFVSWKDNMLRFQNTPFPDVVKKLERWYDVKIILDDKLKFTQQYTMTIKTESLREMLELMLVTTPMNYEIKEDLVYITYKNKMPMR